ncbi:MAG: lipopolysaccharide biosynthesis protein [Ignavibacteriales bacterium]|nr:MAG: lipopolysaccharide biosynthesis protein [Ignavibacteriales bacterium]
MTKEYFKKGILLYFLGNVSSKLITLLLLPLFTYYLTQEEFGLFDVLNTIVMFFVPIVGVQLFEGILRFLLDSNETNKHSKVITTSFYFLLINLVLLNLFFLAIVNFINIPHSTWLLLYFNFYFINFYLQRISRGLQLQKVFAFSGIINTLVIAIVSALFLIQYDFKTDGLLAAYFFGSFSSSIYLIFSTKIHRYIRIVAFDKILLNQLLVYSIPLLFDAVLWWTMNLSDRLILGYFNGTGDVGIYSVANKFAALLTFLNHIFYLVWQEYALINSSDSSRIEEFKKIFIQYVKIQFTGILILMPISKFAIQYLIDEKFISAYLFVPALMIGAMYSSLAAFYGIFYQRLKRTSGALYTSLIAAILNVGANFLLIPSYGIWAAAGSTMAAFLLLLIIRMYIFRDSFNLGKSFLFKVLIAVILLTLSLSLYFNDGIHWQIINLLFAVVLFLVINKNFIQKLFTRTSN